MAITILDYGMGNLRSVEKAIVHLGYEATIQTHLRGVEKLIIPGVGAFGAAMERIGPLTGEIRRIADSGAPILGICLGQQLLLESSEELGEHEGLGLVGGRVRYLPNGKVKVPQIGWNEAHFRAGSSLGVGVQERDQVYFVHSLYTDCASAGDVAAWTSYGIDFPSAIESGNIWGTQFHPEKSGAVGLKILENFLRVYSPLL